MTELIKTDICVIGAGPGGLSVAAAAAAFGVPVVLIEGGKPGGQSLNHRAVRSKALLAAARRAEMLRRAAPFGVMAQRPAVDHGGGIEVRRGLHLAAESEFGIFRRARNPRFRIVQAGHHLLGRIPDRGDDAHARDDDTFHNRFPRCTRRCRPGPHAFTGTPLGRLARL